MPRVSRKGGHLITRDFGSERSVAARESRIYGWFQPDVFLVRTRIASCLSARGKRNVDCHREVAFLLQTNSGGKLIYHVRPQCDV